MELKEILDIVIIPVSLALLALIWPVIQSASKRHDFKGLILRELEELSPYPEDAQYQGWWEHQSKNFVHQQIFKSASDNRDFILSLEPDLVYFVSQLWDARVNKDDAQWLYYLKKLSNPKYDKSGKVAKAREKWLVLCTAYQNKRSC